LICFFGSIAKNLTLLLSICDLAGKTRFNTISAMQQTDSTTSLFGEFPASTAAEWKAKIIKDLKGIDYNTLLWQTAEGFDIQPFYTAEDLAPESGELTGRDSTTPWLNRELIEASQPATVQQHIQNALANGADAVQLNLGNSSWQAADIAKALQGTALNQVPVAFNCSEAAAIQAYIKQYHPSVSALKGSISFDALAHSMIQETNLAVGFDQIYSLHNLFKEASNFTTITVGGHHFHNSGAGTVQELAFTLASVVTYLDELTQRGATAEELCNDVEFSVSVGTNYFFEIAKLRALRLLWLKIAAAYGVTVSTVRIHAETSQWALTAADPYVNMLRHTTEAMSALTGGCTSLTVLPYNWAISTERDEFSARIARNVSTILKEESYFDKTSNAASGSYYLEKLTDSLAEAAWQQFLEVEEKGGIVKAFEDGWIQDTIAASRAKKLEALRNGSEVLVGTTKYSITGEGITHEAARASDSGHFLQPMPAYRYL
jgi:methylmalonyl-CoA mutase